MPLLTEVWAVSAPVLCRSFDFFFFQAEDGIRDTSVTGVQTCALPICQRGVRALTARTRPVSGRMLPLVHRRDRRISAAGAVVRHDDVTGRPRLTDGGGRQIGRASCRERVGGWSGGGGGRAK